VRVIDRRRDEKGREPVRAAVARNDVAECTAARFNNVLERLDLPRSLAGSLARLCD